MIREITDGEVKGYSFGAKTPQGEAIDLEADFRFDFGFDGDVWRIAIPQGWIDSIRIDGGNEITPTDEMIAALRSKVSDDEKLIEYIEENMI